MSSQTRALSAIFVTVMVDMLSFGLVMPNLQLTLERFGTKDWHLGLILASFSLATFISAPIAGRLSDRFGRKPVLLAGAILNVISFVLYARADTVGWILASRIFGGLGASNLSAAFAYVADNSPPERRAQAMALIGAAFGMGFILGPVVGGQLAEYGGNRLLGEVSAVICVVNVFWILVALPEPRGERSRESAAVFSVSKFVRAVTNPQLGALLLMFFAYNFAFSNMESTFFRLMFHRFGLEEGPSGRILGFVGLVMVFMQAAVVGRLVRRIGEVRMIRAGILMVAPFLAILPFVPSPAAVYLVSIPLAAGSAMYTPSVQALISKTASKSIQGGVMGVTQGLGAMARILGPTVGNSLFGVWHPLPYVTAGVVMALPLVISWYALRPSSHLAPSAPDQSGAHGS